MTKIISTDYLSDRTK